MRLADVLLVAWVLVFAASGFVRGLASQLLSFVGVFAGLVGGAWIAPQLLRGGEESPWVPLASLAGAAIGAVTLGIAAGAVAGRAESFLAERRSLRVIDRIGGVAAGAVLAIGLAWLAAVVFLHQPALGLRDAVQRSALLPALVRAVPPEGVLRALDRFDPLPILPNLAVQRLPRPDASVLRSTGARAAAASVVKIEGTACGLGVQGSGWVVRRGLVATNVHVIAGEHDTRVLTPSGQTVSATVVYVDAGNDVALLHAPGLTAVPLRLNLNPSFPIRVALLGYPRDGRLTATAGTAGRPRTIVAPDAYRRRVRPRIVVPLRGRIEPGESGGPVIDRRGRVVAMIFGGSRGGRAGYAVPADLVARGLVRRQRSVDPGPCLG